MASEGREFPSEIVEPNAWTIKGIGMYGSDQEVVSLDFYRRLAARCENAEHACLMWARKCIELEGRDPSNIEADVLLPIAESLRLPLSAVLNALESPRGE